MCDPQLLTDFVVKGDVISEFCEMFNPAQAHCNIVFNVSFRPKPSPQNFTFTFCEYVASHFKLPHFSMIDKTYIPYLSIIGNAQLGKCPKAGKPAGEPGASWRQPELGEPQKRR